MNHTTILIVDDEEELRENLQDLLEFKGYQVETFATGEEFLEEFDSISGDLVLLDIQLPGVDGLEVLRRIKERRPHMPVAMVSASSVRGILDQAEAYGADRIILKPYSHEDILQAVEEIVNRAGA